MAYRRKSRGTRGLKCVRKKRVRIRGGGTAMRCAKYGSRRSSYRRKATSSRRRSTRRRRSTKRRATGMAKRGSHCVRRKYVYSRVLRKRVKRCAQFRGGR